MCLGDSCNDSMGLDIEKGYVNILRYPFSEKIIVRINQKSGMVSHIFPEE